MAPDCIIRSTDGKSTCLEEVRPFYEQLGRAFPDLHTTVKDLIAEENKVAGIYSESGTMKGDFMGIKATGKRFTMFGIEIYRFANGKIVEVWEVRDMTTLMQQLGVVPLTGQAGGNLLFGNPENASRKSLQERRTKIGCTDFFSEGGSHC